MKSNFFNVWLLALCYALGLTSIPLITFMGSLLGAELAPTPKLATLPIAAMVIGTAVGTLPVSLLIKRLGAKTAYIACMLVGAYSCWLGGQALVQRSFGVFCMSAALIGVANAALLQLRFTAMESVTPERAPTAAATVLCGGILVAIVGPEMAVRGQHLTSVDYQGSIWLVGICFIAASLLLLLIKPTRQHTMVTTVSTRPISLMVKNPAFCLAVASASVGFVIMTFLMTATPISMHHHHGYSLFDTKWVIQGHIASMFFPSLISPLLFRWVGIRGMIVAGLGTYSLTIAVGLVDNSVMGYWMQLVMLGVGWNLLFVAGTALLPSTYLRGEKFKAQAFNDGVVFSFQALAALSAGWVISSTNWQSVLLFCLGPMMVLLLVLIWQHRNPELLADREKQPHLAMEKP